MARPVPLNGYCALMPLDAYSLCPGGTGKKIKFCCPDFLDELQIIDRMLEGEQYLACLQRVEQLLQRHPDRACLLAMKTTLLRVTGKPEEARAAAAVFLERHPDNTTAMAESAVLTAAEQGGSAAVGTLQRAVSLLGRRDPAVRVRCDGHRG